MANGNDGLRNRRDRRFGPGSGSQRAGASPGAQSAAQGAQGAQSAQGSTTERFQQGLRSARDRVQSAAQRIGATVENRRNRTRPGRAPAAQFDADDLSQRRRPGAQATLADEDSLRRAQARRASRAGRGATGGRPGGTTPGTARGAQAGGFRSGLRTAGRVLSRGLGVGPTLAVTPSTAEAPELEPGQSAELTEAFGIGNVPESALAVLRDGGTMEEAIAAGSEEEIEPDGSARTERLDDGEGLRLRGQGQGSAEIRGRISEGGGPGQGAVSTVGSEFFTGPGPTSQAVIDARRAALERGDLSAVRRSLQTPEERAAADRERRRRSLRRQVSQSRGFDQSLGSLVQEGLRRRSAAGELDRMALEDEAATERAFEAQQAQTPDVGERIRLAELAADQRERNEDEDRAAREETRNILDRFASFNDAEGRTRVNQRQRDLAEEFIRRSDLEPEDPRDVQTGIDALELAQALDAEAEEASEVPGLGVFTDFFQDEQPTQETAQQVVDELEQALASRFESRSTRRGAPLRPIPTDAIVWRGQRIQIQQLPAEMQQRLRNLEARLGGGSGDGGEG